MKKMKLINALHSILISAFTMAAPVSSVFDAMVLCGIDNVDLHDGQTKAQRIATGVFSDDFNTCMVETMEDLQDDLKSFSDLTVAEGRIRLTPGPRKNIKAFIQWCRDEIREGRDPAQSVFPVGESVALRERMKAHDNFMKSKAKDDAAPEVFNDDMSWEDWVKTFKAYLRLVTGESGIPLSYVIRDDENPNMADQGNFLANYAARAPLNGDYYDRDNETVYVLIVKFTAQNTRAKDALKTVVNENDGREAFMTIKSQFEGEGIMQTKVTNAE